MVTEWKRKAEDDGASRHEHEKSVRELKEFLLQTLIGALKTIPDENRSVKMASTSKFPSQCRS